MPKRARTHADTLRVQERRDLVFDLRQQGGTYREIAQYMRENRPDLCNPEKYDHSHVFQDIDVELQRYATRIEGKAHILREEENARLEMAYGKMMRKVMSSGDMFALDRMLAIHDRRVKLYGLASPQKVAMTDPTGEKPAAGGVVVYLPDNGRGDRTPDIIGEPPPPGATVALPSNGRDEPADEDDDGWDDDDEVEGDDGDSDE